MLVRSMLENMFYLCRLAGDDGSAFSRKMMADDEIHRGHLGKAIVTTRGAEVGSRVKEIADELLQKTRGEKILSPRGVVKGTEIETAYVYYKQLSSDAAHPSISALKRHFGEREGIEGLLLRPRIEDGEMIGTASFASMALLAVCIAANTSFGPTAGAERLEGLLGEYHELTARTMPNLKG